MYLSRGDWHLLSRNHVLSPRLKELILIFEHSFMEYL